MWGKLTKSEPSLAKFGQMKPGVDQSWEDLDQMRGAFDQSWPDLACSQPFVADVNECG